MASSPSKFLQLRTEEHSSRVQDNINATLRPLAQAVGATPIMGAPPPAWISPNLLADFVNVGGGSATAGYHRDALGYVHIKGLVSTAAGTAANTTIFTIAMGYRPKESLLLPVFGTAGAVQFVTITPAGAVQARLLIAAGGSIGLNVTYLAES